MLFDPAAHEQLAGEPWSEARARAAIKAIVAEAEDAFDPDSVWPLHPVDGHGEPDAEDSFGLWIGAAGVVWALGALERAGAVELRRDWAPIAGSLHERYLARSDKPVPGLWMGEAGILLAAESIAPSSAAADRLYEVVRANAGNETNELMWGSPGTMLAACAMFDRTGETRWREAWDESADRLWDEWRWSDEHGCHLWTQRLYGYVESFLGPAHGFAGNVLALAALEDGRRDELARRATETLTRLAVREDGLANWGTRAGAGLAGGDGRIRVQWCHGAPGMVASLADIVADDELLVAGGELTWTAGPLAKGPGLCHGTAGNGYAFLKLFRRTGDERWLERARAFALHAAAQVERARAEYGRGRFSLWTGDIGAALYLWHCLDGDADVPTIDAW